MKISQAESRILEALWQAGRPLASEEVFASLGEDPDWTAGTVRTLLTRLVNKKAAATTLDGRRYLFSPLIERSAYVQAESQGLLDRLFGGSLTPLIHHFAHHRDLTPDEVETLKALIAEMEKKRG